MSQGREWWGVTGLGMAVVAIAVGLHAIGNVPGFAVDWRAPAVWLEQARPEEALAALLRTMGLIGCYWVLGSVVLYSLTSRRARVPRLVMLVTLPALRRIVNRALATALTASLASAPMLPATAAAPYPATSSLSASLPPVATAEETPRRTALDIHHDGIPIPHLRLDQEALSEPEGRSVQSPEDPDAAAASPTRTLLVPVTTTAIPPLPSTYAVVTGDNLWRIAEDIVHEYTIRSVAEDDIAEYWRRLIEANRHSFRSGDPNLIYPGELLELPVVDGAP